MKVEEQNGFSDGYFHMVERVEGKLLNRKLVDVTFCWKFIDG